MTQEQIQIILFDLYDLRYTLTQQTKDEHMGLGMGEGVTIGEHLDNIIESVEALEGTIV